MSKTERLARFADATGVARMVRRLGAWTGILVFNYHRIGFDSAYNAGIWDASPPSFEQQVLLLKKEFDVIAPVDLETAVRARSGRYVMLTFDDGYRDNFAEALPVLKAHGVPATFFVTTDFLDTGRIAWWDEIAWIVHSSHRNELPAGSWLERPLSMEPGARATTTKLLINVCMSLSRQRQDSFLDFLADAADTGRHRPGGEFWMTWDQVRQIRAAGMYVGGHSVTHPLLAGLSTDQQRREVIGCRARLVAELGEPMLYFSYPYGGKDSFDESTRRILAANGVEFAFSFYGGYQDADDWDRYDVRRCCVGVTVSPQRFALMATLPQVFSRPRAKQAGKRGVGEGRPTA